MRYPEGYVKPLDIIDIFLDTEAIAEQAQEQKKERLSTRANSYRGLPVTQYTLDGQEVATYKSAHAAAKALGLWSQSIIRCCKGADGYATAGKYKWKFDN